MDFLKIGDGVWRAADYLKLWGLEDTMGRHIGIGSYWLGTACAVLALIARGLDVVGMNFIDFETKGGGFGYHSLMDGTLFFYAISIATMVHAGFNSQKGEPSLDKESQKPRQDAKS